MKPWRLTGRAERSLVEIITWTIERFGERQAISCRDALIERIAAIAAGRPPHPRPGALLMRGYSGAADLVYFQEGWSIRSTPGAGDGRVAADATPRSARSLPLWRVSSRE